MPQSIITWIKEISSRFGKIKLTEAPDVHFADEIENTAVEKTEDGKEIVKKIMYIEYIQNTKNA